ncbi:MAG: ferritin-like domain-containing protein [Sphaerobacter sp.]|nr:ferritin-like domain-containing protein [Sphaerobacter sp.]
MDKQRLIDGLNQDLAAELAAIIQYLHFSATVTGPDRLQLQGFFAGEIPDELGHATFLANKIAALGGKPTVEPRPVKTATDARQMLELALEAEKQAIRDYTERARQAEEFGDIGLKVQLENQILDETQHKEELEKLLAKQPAAV